MHGPAEGRGTLTRPAPSCHWLVVILEGVADALVSGAGLAVDAVGVDLEQDGDAVPGAAGDFDGGDARVQPQRHRRGPQVEGPAGQRRCQLGSGASYGPGAAAPGQLDPWLASLRPKGRTACSQSSCPIQAAPDQGSCLVQLGPAGGC
jgi:hypothetical protein